MCAWLAQPEAADWTLETGLLYTRQKERVRQKLVELMGWPNEKVCVEPSTSRPPRNKGQLDDRTGKAFIES